MRILERSLEIARALYPVNFDERRCLHWSFAWKGSKLLAVGENKYKTSPRNLRNQGAAKYPIEAKKTCSELSMFTKLRTTYQDLDYKKLRIVNIRIDRTGNINNSKPCIFCKQLFFQYLNIRHLWFTTDEGKFELY